MKTGQSLIRDLIAALNGDDYEAANEIVDQIRTTDNKELIEQADYLLNIL